MAITTTLAERAETKEAAATDAAATASQRHVDTRHLTSSPSGSATGGEPDQGTTHRDVNARLFSERQELRDRIARLERIAATGGDGTTSDATTRSRLRRLQRRLDELTDEIVSSNLGLVRSYTRRFGGAANADARAEFEAAGLLGLMRAVDSYEPDRGPFGQWAFKPIQREVLRAVRDRDHPNLNHGDFEKRPLILRTQRQLRSIDDSYEPSYEEIAAAADVTVAQVKRVLDPPRLDSISDTPNGAAHSDDDLEGDHEITSDGPRPDEAVISGMTLAGLQEFALRALDSRELFVVVRRFGLDGEPIDKLNEIGDLLGLSREAIRQIEGKALAKLQHPMVVSKIGRPAPVA